MDFLFFCCNNKKNTALEMRLLSKNEHERIIGDLLEENNIMDYNFIWISDKLPCDNRYLEGRIYSDILNNSYTSVNIIINKKTITLRYDNQTCYQSQIFINI